MRIHHPARDPYSASSGHQQSPGKRLPSMASEAPENSEQQASAPQPQQAPAELQDMEPETNAPPAPEPKMPSRKDTSLREFLHKIDDYAPVVCQGGTSLS
jgi:transcription initiation factor TFIID subunit 10